MSGMYNAMSGTSDRSVKIPLFQPGKFTLLNSKFKAVALIKGFAEALEPEF